MKSKIYKNVQDYLTTDVNIKIYDQLTDSKQSTFGLFEPFFFFTQLYKEVDFFLINCKNYPAIKQHYAEIQNGVNEIIYNHKYEIHTKREFTYQEKAAFLFLKILLIVDANLEVKNFRKHYFETKACYFFLSELIYEMGPEDIIEPEFSIFLGVVYCIHDLREHLDKYVTKGQKISTLIDAINNYKHADNETRKKYLDENFIELCELEIEKEKFKSSFIINENSKVSRTDFIRIINALYEMGAFEKWKNGPIPSKKEVMHAFGSLVGLDLKDYFKDLNIAYSKTLNINLDIFEKMKNVTSKIITDKI